MKILQGDCLIKLKELPDNSVDSVVTDPPYGLVSIVKRFGKEGSAPAKFGTDGAFARASKGFMGKEWDGTGIEYNIDMWAECLRVLKPGGYLLSFGGTRTYHRMAVAIEDAGFEVRDMIEWIYGSGFPKSLNIGKAVDKLQGNEREDLGEYDPRSTQDGANRQDRAIGGQQVAPSETSKLRLTKGISEWEGWGTALKPAHEPICMARKPLGEKTVAENCLKWGVGGINIDESMVRFNKENESFGKKVNDYGEKAGGHWQQGKQIRSVPPELGRFPANLILSWRENEYIMKEGVNNEQKEKICTWLQKNL